METYTVTVDNNRTEWKNEKGELHRVNGPAIEYADGSKEWYLNGKLHRVNGPAVECTDGEKWWYLNGQHHRINGPAVELASGGKWWYLHGKYHRENGPALECADGAKYWYLDGIELSEEEFNKRINSCDGKIVEVDGKKYSLKLL